MQASQSRHAIRIVYLYIVQVPMYIPAAYACTRWPADSLTGSGLRSRRQWSIATAMHVHTVCYKS